MTGAGAIWSASLRAIAELRSRPPSAQGAGQLMRPLLVRIEIDILDADLRPLVACAGVPSAAAKLDVAHLGKVQAFPLSAGSQSRAAVARKLVRQGAFLALCMSEHNRTDCACQAGVDAKHLFAFGHRLGE